MLQKVSVGMLDEDQSFIAIIGLICHYEELKCAKLVVRLRERLRVGLRPRKTGNKLKWRYFIFYVGNIKSVGELGRMGAALDITVWGIIGEVVRSLTLWQSGIDPLTMAMGMVVMVKFFIYLTGVLGLVPGSQWIYLDPGFLQASSYNLI